MEFILRVFAESWGLLLDSAIYIIFGIVVGGLIKVFFNPAFVAAQLGKGRFLPVIKAALVGIPLPLCSCGVLPAAVSLKKQGANNGAVTSFLISTPESGVDSMAVTYALMDPVMTLARPASALITAVAAGVAENLTGRPEDTFGRPDLSCPVDGCCDGEDCDPAEHQRHHTFGDKLAAGMRFAFGELWGELAGWFLVGLLAAGVITASLPEDVLTRHLGGGLPAMLLMLLVGIPLYICATASTPIAAALILKGLSPGAALVFLLAGPATNLTSLTMLTGVLGKRATAIYLGFIAVFSVACGLLLDMVYLNMGISARVVAGQAAEIMPFWLKMIGALVLLALSVGPVTRAVKSKIIRRKAEEAACHCGPECRSVSQVATNPPQDTCGPNCG